MAFSVVALGAAGLQIVQRMVAAVHQCNDVVYCVGWFVAVVAGWVVSQDDGPVAFVFWV